MRYLLTVAFRLRKLWPELKEEWSPSSLRSDWYYHKLGASIGSQGYYDNDTGKEVPDRPPYRASFAGFLWFHGKTTLRSLTCCFLDHNWRDTSYGGPDSGEMSGSCKRCGYSFHTQLY
jgi:hypothetical protein